MGCLYGGEEGVGRMSREIKFRAWDKLEKVIFNPKKIDFDCLNDGKTYVWRSPYENELCNWSYHAFEVGNEVELMQFTGLKDKNGVEIYEGDLIRATKGGWSREFEIIWKEDQARFMAWEASQPNISFDLTRETIIELHVIVIGNTYPNPEPLEVIQ